MKIDDREVPAGIVAQCRQALGGPRDAALSGVARAHTAIQAGFRPSRVPPVKVNHCAGALLDTLIGLTQPLYEGLSAGGPQGQLLCVPSEQALARHAGAWCGAVGPVPTSAAMLLDERPAVPALGFSQMAARDGTEPDEPAAERARDELTESFAPFLRRLGPLFTHQSVAAGSKADTSTPAPTLRPPLAAQECELIIALRGQRQQARHAERDALRARLETATADLALDHVNAAQQQMLARLAKLVRQGLQAQAEARQCHWPYSAAALHRDVRVLAEGSLLYEAGVLLCRQPKVHRRVGLRGVPAVELHRTRRTLAEVQHARVDALNPLPQFSNLPIRYAWRSVLFRGMTSAARLRMQ